ncbi:MAG TPA: hypothetical protein VFP72_22100 [Kineosporiaceae bacterium]|nr:hypothetical protein [Kineosporiaceae bacterium]
MNGPQHLEEAGRLLGEAADTSMDDRDRELSASRARGHALVAQVAAIVEATHVQGGLIPPHQVADWADALTPETPSRAPRIVQDGKTEAQLLTDAMGPVEEPLPPHTSGPGEPTRDVRDDPAGRLREAIRILTDRQRHAVYDIRSNDYWRDDTGDDEIRWMYGVTNALGGPAGSLAATITPEVARCMAAVLQNALNVVTDVAASSGAPFPPDGEDWTSILALADAVTFTARMPL